jgi:hypothetical protein
VQDLRAQVRRPRARAVKSAELLVKLYFWAGERQFDHQDRDR